MPGVQRALSVLIAFQAVGVERWALQHSGTVKVHHVERAIDQVPQAVGEVCVVALAQPLLGKIGVASGRNIARQIIADRLRPAAAGDFRDVRFSKRGFALLQILLILLGQLLRHLPTHPI